MERSLVIIKPDAMKRNLATTILSRFEQQGLKLIALKMIHISEALASRHYYAHKDKPFYDELIEFIRRQKVFKILGGGGTGKGDQVDGFFLQLLDQQIDVVRDLFSEVDDYLINHGPHVTKFNR